MDRDKLLSIFAADKNKCLCDLMKVSHDNQKSIIICIEEMSELIKELTKHLRGNTDVLGVLEEIVDVQLALQYIIKTFEISEDDLAKMTKIKLNRVYGLIKEGKSYE